MGSTNNNLVLCGKIYKYCIVTVLIFFFYACYFQFDHYQFKNTFSLIKIYAKTNHQLILRRNNQTYPFKAVFIFP